MFKLTNKGRNGISVIHNSITYDFTTVKNDTVEMLSIAEDVNEDS